MAKLTGKDLIRAIQRVIDLELLRSRKVRNDRISALLGEFYSTHGIPATGMRFNSQFLRAVKDRNFAFVREFSPNLARLEENELAFALTKLQLEIEEAESKAQQIKTQASFVLAMFRPFEAKYTDRWIVDRTDIDLETLPSSINRILNAEISSLDTLLGWMDEVELVFRELVEFDAGEVNEAESRPYGTVSPKSARIYLGAWKELKQKAQLVLDLARETNLDDAPSVLVTTSERKLRRDTEDSLPLRSITEMAPMRVATKSTSAKSQNLDQSLARNIVAVERRLPRESSGNSTLQKMRVSIQIDIFSEVNSSAKATRTWKTEVDFEKGLPTWIKSLPALWGNLADKLGALVAVQTSASKSEVSIPGLTLDSAQKRIAAAVSSLIEA